MRKYFVASFHAVIGPGYQGLETSSSLRYVSFATEEGWGNKRVGELQSAVAIEVMLPTLHNNNLGTIP